MKILCRVMQKKKGLRLLAAALAIVLAAAFPLPETAGIGTAQAAGSTQEIANVVVFVKFQDDNKDIFNAVNNQATPAQSNWQEFKNMYDLDQDSFSNYIAAITENKIHVTNYFPQERADRKGVQTLVIPRGDGQGYIAGQVVKALSDGRISMGAISDKLDNRQNGVLDNLTVIIQGNATDWGQAAYRATYAGSGGFNGIRIMDYNVIPSSSLVSENASLSYRSRQGVIAHEFLHTLGLPDLYRDSGNGAPVGYWDIMASVSGFLQYPLSYLRAREGWIPMKTITQSGEYTLTAVSEIGGDKVFALRTPLSDSELICLEYRRRSTDPNKFEYSIPDSGLLMYRVDNKVDGLSNHAGKNYIYVYRPGGTYLDAVDDDNAIKNAALNPDKGRTKYGTTDLGADFTQNTLYYSDGSNSGIEISNVQLSTDQKRLTFTVTFADYSDSGVWDKLGDEISGQCGDDPDVCVDPATGTLYAAYTEEIPGSATGATRIRVKSWNGTAWQQVGQSIDNARTPSLAVCSGEMYLSYYRSTDHAAVYCRLGGSTWAQIRADGAQYPQSMQFVVDGSDIYGVYEGMCNDGVRMVIRNLKSGSTVTESLTTSISFARPRLVKAGNSFYMVCAEFPRLGQSSTSTQIREYNMSTGKWSTVHTIASMYTSEHCMVKQGQKIYVFAGAAGEGSYMTVFDGNSWSSAQVLSVNQFNNASMDVVNGETYLAYYDTAAKCAKLLKGTGTALTECADRLGSGLDYLKICSYGDTLYAATRAQNTGNMVVRVKSLSQGGTDVPQQRPRTLALTPPAGYEDAIIYVDGVEYAAQKSGGSYQVQLPDTLGRTAVMYSYNDKNVPVGMYVWKLVWQGDICTATPMPGLQDMLSYHGFSIRVQDPAGIRFKSGIDVGLKRSLTTTGVDGCLLKEYGTLFITNENRDKYPFIKGGTKVGGGRAYWIENGKVNDKVFETVAGRNRFTSVLINLAPNMYAKDISFRAYAVLDCGGQEIIIYGPPVYRSVYTVAKQVQAKGEFKVGSSGYRYVQGIIDSVEGR